MILQALPMPAADPLSMADSLRTTTIHAIEQMKSDPNSFLTQLGEDAIHFGLKVLAALAIYIVGAWLIRKLKKLLEAIFTRRHTEGTISSFVLSLVSISMYLILTIISIGTLGINTTSLAALLAAGGMAIGMALSGTVQNFAGGIMLLIFKPFKAGDFICAQNYSGTVKEVTIFSTKILTTDNRMIIIPNGVLSNNTIDNYSEKPLRRLEWKVSVEYGSDADLCIRELKKLILSDLRILDSSTKGTADPLVALMELGDSSIVFVVRAWVKSKDYWNVFYDINKKIYTTLPSLGVNFAYPHLDVTLRN